LAGKRSGLFWEICRILDETGTQTVILENVPGLLSSNQGRDMAVVIEALVERGYRVGWRVLDAQHFGVPQRRRRVFIVGCLRDSGRTPEEILDISQSRAGYLEASKSKGKDSAGKIADSAGNGGERRINRMQSFGQYEDDLVTSALKARDYKDATDLVVD
jgi:DNA (cytosine-5)-methyltransferase 1